MTNKIRSILGSILGWLISLIFMFAFQDNTKKSMTVYAQAICLAIILFGGLIVTKILALIPYLGWILTILLDLVLWGGYAVFTIMNIVKAVQYDTIASTEIPLIGKMANAIFGSVIAKGLDAEPVAANGGPVDPNMNQQPNANPNMNAQPNPNMNTQGPVNPTAPQQPTNNDTNNMNQQ